MPKLSVIIPIYNAQYYLRQCLDSVTNQTLKDIEIICVNDGSTDGSQTILEEYAKKDNRIVVIEQANASAGAARNKGIHAAKGEYLHFLDADDWVEPVAYEWLYRKISKTNSDICIFQYTEFDQITNKYTKVPHILSLKTAITDFNKNSRYFLYNAVVPWNKIYKKEFILSNNIEFDEIMCANDRSFYVNILLKAKRIMVTNKYFIYYRVNNSNSLVGLARLKNFDCHFYAYNSTQKLCSSLDQKRKAMVIDITMQDFFTFYYKAEGAQKDQIAQKLNDYFQTMDIRPCLEKLFDYDWCWDYLHIKGEARPNLTRIAKKRILPNIGKHFIYIRDEGIGRLFVRIILKLTRGCWK